MPACVLYMCADLLYGLAFYYKCIVTFLSNGNIQPELCKDYKFLYNLIIIIIILILSSIMTYYNYISFYLCIFICLILKVESFTPTARHSHSSVLVENKLYFFGGVF